MGVPYSSQGRAEPGRAREGHDSAFPRTLPLGSECVRRRVGGREKWQGEISGGSERYRAPEGVCPLLVSLAASH